jgi:hypothetical protein
MFGRTVVGVLGKVTSIRSNVCNIFTADRGSLTDVKALNTRSLDHMLKWLQGLNLKLHFRYESSQFV